MPRSSSKRRNMREESGVDYGSSTTLCPRGSLGSCNKEKIWIDLDKYNNDRLNWQLIINLSLILNPHITKMGGLGNLNLRLV